FVGNAGTDTVVVRIRDNLPTANAGPDRTGSEGSAVSFSGSGTDVEGALTYSWTFGDGGPATGANVSHAYADEGTYTATLTVTDSGGQAVGDTAVVTVSNVAPTANAGPARSGDEGAPITFLGSATDPGVNDVLTYSWTFGDGGT